MNTVGISTGVKLPDKDIGRTGSFKKLIKKLIKVEVPPKISQGDQLQHYLVVGSFEMDWLGSISCTNKKYPSSLLA